MMKMTGKAFAKKLFGARYERLPRTLLLDAIIFWGLYTAGFQVQIAASVRILMINAFTAGVMWQALTSKDNAVELKTMLMLPQQPKEFVFSYVAALGGYTVLTKTGLLLGHPRLRPALEELELAERELDIEGMVQSAADRIERIQV